jgi:hypothetical protein
LYAGEKADSDVNIVENDSESKGNNDQERDKDGSPLSEEDSKCKSNGIGMTTIPI